MKRKAMIRNIVMAGLCAAIITVCSWITVPVLTIPFTLQTFAIFLMLFLFDYKVSLLAITVYLLLGIAGVPVFANFKAGIGAIMGPTGGYLLGFIFMPLIYLLVIKIGKNTFISKIIGLLVSLFFLYIFGSVWFFFIYMNKGQTIDFIKIMSMCVIPFIGPDIIKGTLAVLLGMQLTKITNRYFALQD